MQTLIRSLTAVLLAGFLFSSFACQNQENWLKTQQLKEEPVSQIDLAATHDNLIEGERTQLIVQGYVGGKPRELSEFVSINLDGPGSVSFRDGRYWYHAESATGEKPAMLTATYNPAQFGRDEPPVKSEPLHIYVQPEESHPDYPGVDSLEKRTVEDLESIKDE